MSSLLPSRLTRMRNAIKKRLVARLVRVIQLPRIELFRVLSSAEMSGRATFRQPAQIVGEGTVEFGERVVIGFFPSPLFFSGYAHLEARKRGSRISIGDDTSINNNFVAIAEHGTITIGARTLIGTCVEIYDSDFHGLRVADRRRSDLSNAADVSIEDDVFIGSNVTILKGVRIGEGSVIASGSVVTNSVPRAVIAGGNPARVIRAL